jgi:hypothetical protein
MSSTTPPDSGGPEYLESSAGSPVERSGSPIDRRKRVIALGGLVGVLAVGGGAVWAATSLLGTGAQPAEALPAGTLGYVSIDLDPSGDQKIEAIQTLRKFPEFKDQINLDTDDDLRERLFEEITKSGECEGLDYEADVKPWLGSRAAFAAVDAGEDAPSPSGSSRSPTPARPRTAWPTWWRPALAGRTPAPVAGSWTGTGSCWPRPRRSPRRSWTRPTRDPSPRTTASPSGRARPAPTASCPSTSPPRPPTTSGSFSPAPRWP